MILDFSFMLDDHEINVQVSELECSKFRTVVRELDSKKKAIVDIAATFLSKRQAIIFAYVYVREYMDEL